MGTEIFYPVLIAFFVLIATWWSANSAYRHSGQLRRAQIAALVLAVLSMLMLSQEQVLAAQIMGALLVAVAAMALLWEKWRSKIFPLIHMLFGLAIILKLPLNGWALGIG